MACICRRHAGSIATEPQRIAPCDQNPPQEQMLQNLRGAEAEKERLSAWSSKRYICAGQNLAGL